MPGEGAAKGEAGEVRIATGEPAGAPGSAPWPAKARVCRGTPAPAPTGACAHSAPHRSQAPPSQFRATQSAAELASADTEAYAEPGLAEHKARGCPAVTRCTPPARRRPNRSRRRCLQAGGGKHLGAYWHRGSAGLRPEGHDLGDEEERLHELEARQVCVWCGAAGRRAGTLRPWLACLPAAGQPAASCPACPAHPS